MAADKVTVGGVGICCGDGVVGWWLLGVACRDAVKVAGRGVCVGDLVAAVEGEAFGTAEVIVFAGEGGFHVAVPGFGVGLEGGNAK